MYLNLQTKKIVFKDWLQVTCFKVRTFTESKLCTVFELSKQKIGSEELITTVELGYNELDGTS